MKDSQEVKTKVDELGLRDLAPSTIRFSIKADDTMENMQVHAAFKDFCRVETDNNYTQGIKKLLEYYQSDYKIEMLHDNIQHLNITLEDLKGSIVELQKKPEVKSENDGTF